MILSAALLVMQYIACISIYYQDVLTVSLVSKKRKSRGWHRPIE